jgi:hypothetical protein
VSEGTGGKVAKWESVRWVMSEERGGIVAEMLRTRRRLLGASGSLVEMGLLLQGITDNSRYRSRVRWVTKSRQFFLILKSNHVNFQNDL